MKNIQTITEEIKKHRLFDSGILKPRGKQEVIDTMNRLQKSNLDSWLLLLPCGEQIEPWRILWDRLKLNEAKDLLLIFNCNQWIARGWGLSNSEISSALNSAESDLGIYYGRGLATALIKLAEKSKPELEKEREDTSFFLPTAGGILLLGAGAAIAAVIRRRMRRAQETQKAFDATLGSARKALADVILAAGDLPSDDIDARDLQLKAVSIGEQIDDLARKCKTQPELKGKATIAGSFLQMENELRALMSTILQKAKDYKKKGEFHAEREN